MPSITYGLTGGNFPVPIAPPSPVIGQPSVPFNGMMQAANTATTLNQYAVASDVARVQYGVGGYAVLGNTPSGSGGLQVSVSSGLNIALSAGLAALDGDYEWIASGNAFGPQALLDATYTVADNSTNFLWVTLASGVPGIAINTTVGSPPANAKLYLATVTAVSGAITVIDYSGRVEMQGGVPTRITGDLGAPVDTPPSGWRGFTQTVFGLFFWNGTYHCPIPSSQQETFNFTSNASVTLAQPYYSAPTLFITDTGSVLSGGVNVVWPASKTDKICVKNGTLQTLTLKTSGGTGFTLASTKHCIMAVNGTDCEQWTAAF
jgi:hypothetical protein